MSHTPNKCSMTELLLAFKGGGLGEKLRLEDSASLPGWKDGGATSDMSVEK